MSSYDLPDLLRAAFMRPPLIPPISAGASALLTAALPPTPPSFWNAVRVVYGWGMDELVELYRPLGLGAVVGL